MPVLQIEEKVEKIYLPSTQRLDKDGNPTAPEADWGFVVMDTSPFCAADTQNIEQGMKGGQISIVALAGRIRDWNFVAPDGTPIPINTQTVGKMNAADYGHLMNLMTGDDGVTEDEKKASSVTSSQPEMGSTL